MSTCGRSLLQPDLPGAPNSYCNTDREPSQTADIGAHNGIMQLELGGTTSVDSKVTGMHRFDGCHQFAMVHGGSSLQTSTLHPTAR